MYPNSKYVGDVNSNDTQRESRNFASSKKLFKITTLQLDDIGAQTIVHHVL